MNEQCGMSSVFYICPALGFLIPVSMQKSGNKNAFLLSFFNKLI
jgi:hypothetical protein